MSEFYGQRSLWPFINRFDNTCYMHVCMFIGGGWGLEEQIHDPMDNGKLLSENWNHWYAPINSVCIINRYNVALSSRKTIKHATSLPPISRRIGPTGAGMPRRLLMLMPLPFNRWMQLGAQLTTSSASRSTREWLDRVKSVPIFPCHVRRIFHVGRIENVNSMSIKAMAFILARNW